MLSSSARKARNFAAASCCSGVRLTGIANPAPPVGVNWPAEPPGRKALPTSKFAALRIPDSDPVDPMTEEYRPAPKSEAWSEEETAAYPLVMYDRR